MAKASASKKRKARKDSSWDDLLKAHKPYRGYSPSDFLPSKVDLVPVRKRSKIIVTTRTFKEMPDGSLIMQVSRHTKPVPKGNATGIDSADDIHMYTDRSGRLHIGVIGDRRRPTGKRGAQKKRARAKPLSAHVKPRSNRA